MNVTQPDAPDQPVAPSVKIVPMESAETSYRAYRDATAVFGHHCRAGFVQHFDGASSIATGLFSANFNTVFVTDDATAGDVQQAVAAFDFSGLPFSASLRVDSAEHARALVESMGLAASSGEPAPLMTTKQPPSIPWPPELDLKSGAEVRDWHLDLLETTFSMPRQMCETLVPTSMVCDDSVDLVVGLAGGIAVATAMGVRIGDTLVVFNVATEADHRGKGYGSAVTSIVADRGFSTGAKQATLTSSPMGRSVYERLGFVTVDHLGSWTISAPGRRRIGFI